MTRYNDFPQGVRIAVVHRATRDGVPYCEQCGLPTKGDHRVDHRTAAGLNGSRKIENAWLLGKCCYAAKDAADNRIVKRAIKMEATHLGVRGGGNSLKSRGFAAVIKKSRCGPTSKTLPRRPL